MVSKHPRCPVRISPCVYVRESVRGRKRVCSFKKHARTQENEREKRARTKVPKFLQLFCIKRRRRRRRHLTRAVSSAASRQRPSPNRPRPTDRHPTASSATAARRNEPTWYVTAKVEKGSYSSGQRASERRGGFRRLSLPLPLSLCVSGDPC